CGGVLRPERAHASFQALLWRDAAAIRARGASLIARGWWRVDFVFHQYGGAPARHALRVLQRESRSMARSFYHEHPDTLVVETEIVDAQPGRALLAQSPFYPGGGGQVADRGLVRAAGGEFSVAGFE